MGTIATVVVFLSVTTFLLNRNPVCVLGGNPAHGTKIRVIRDPTPHHVPPALYLYAVPWRTTPRTRRPYPFGITDPLHRRRRT
uniref:Secreted protein n=1 Tax=Rhipicephalus appendiculatus TaxID=34631 RepID=A0A131YHJ6_RHIAP